MTSLSVLSRLLSNKVTSSYLVVAFFFNLFVLDETLISNDIIYGAKSGFIFSTDRVMRLSNLEGFKTEHTSKAVDQLTGQNT